ncbi:hypothetical protein N7449_001734 [Penicillium cf. viridicatum]|uniref:Uncharacterized protein n=1 Tax=Penicillium cf. viridicatum TaxID=2972119 RepID=A0A9W9TAJ8_9EURO|nr:hypothetical protein N7449_001734 [Penicillium cf. viridicatum]
MALRIGPQDILQGRLPPLEEGPYKTSSSALHDLKFIGPLREWPCFFQEVASTYNAQKWNETTLGHKTGDPSAPIPELVHTGDEHGVQGRFLQAVGHSVSAALNAQGINLVFADFKCTGTKYSCTPDVVVMQKEGNLRVVWELKVPWVEVHKLHQLIKDEDDFRQVLGQPLKYMRELYQNYGFISTYDETIFLRQRLVDGKWIAEFSPIVSSETTFAENAPIYAPVVSAKQCFFHVAIAATGPQGPVNDTRCSK